MRLRASLGSPVRPPRTAENLLVTCEYSGSILTRRFPLCPLFPASASEAPKVAEISNRSSVPKRRTNSRCCSRYGFLRSTVRPCYAEFTSNYPNTPYTAQSEWSLFSLDQLPSSSGSVSVDEGAGDAVTGTEQQVPATATTVAVLPTTGAPSHDRVTAQPVVLPGLNTTDDTTPPPDVPAITSPCDREVIAFEMPAFLDLETPTLPDLEAPTLSSSRSSPPDAEPSIATGGLPSSVREAVWMKSKKTLKYFQGVHKMGKLSDLILHWYQLEEALGFPEVVSHPSDCLGCESIS